MNAVSPVYAPIELEKAHPQDFRASWVVDFEDPIFRGHYPGFAIYPGVCLIEAAHKVALAHAAQNGSTTSLVSVISARFRRPVFPGNRIIVDGKTVLSEDGSRLALARIEYLRPDGECGEAARVQLQYERAEE